MTMRCAKAMGLLVLVVITGAAWAENYSYDALGRVTSVIFDDGSTQNFTYDPAGNRVTAITSAGGAGGGAACPEVPEDPFTWVIDGRFCSSGENYTPAINHGETQVFTDPGRFMWTGSATFRCENGTRVLVTATCG